MLLETFDEKPIYKLTLRKNLVIVINWQVLTPTPKVI